MSQSSDLLSGVETVDAIARLIQEGFPANGFWRIGPCLEFCQAEIQGATCEHLRKAIARIGWRVNQFSFIIREAVDV